MAEPKGTTVASTQEYCVSNTAGSRRIYIRIGTPDKPGLSYPAAIAREIRDILTAALEECEANVGPSLYPEKNDKKEN